MFRNVVIHLFRRAGFLACIAGVAIISLTACTREYGSHEQSGDAKVILNIRTPRSMATGTTDGIQRPEEGNVEELHVLVFHDAGGVGEYRYAYTVAGTRTSTEQGNNTRFEAMVRTTNFPLKLVVLANSREALTSFSPSVGEEELSVRERLEVVYPTDGLAGNLPMFGEVSLPQLDAGVVNTLNVSVLRAVARVDVKCELDAGSPPFELREVRIYRANDRMRLIPDNGAVDGALKVSAPTVPATAGSLGQPLIKAAQNPADSIGGVYLPESVGLADSEQRRTAATTVVVGGVFDGDADVSYYRVDFNAGVDGHPFGQVLRNYLYNFTVKRVTASGWPTPEEAATNLATAMTVEVQPWEDFTSDIYFHDNYIGVSTRSVQMPFLPGYVRTVDVESSMHYSMEWLGSPGAGSVSDYGTPLSNGYFTATILHDPTDADNVTHIRIDSPQYNTTDNEITATLRLSANDTAVDIKVVKESPSRYSDRVFQVMSTGTSFGSMGDYATNGGYTVAMRRVLDVNFATSSSYPFKIGGFFYLTIPVSGAIYSASTTPADIAYFKKMISNVDILILAYANVTSPQVADMLFDEWLVEKPNRVLWVMLDSSANNIGITNRLRSDGLGSWQNIGNAFSTTYGYRAANGSDFEYSNATEVQQFFTGPFGTVTPGSLLFYGDAVAGQVLLPDTAKQAVTPLVYNNNPAYANYMSLGVETRRGVIYQGEAQLFQGGYGMSAMAGSSADANGTIISDPQVTGGSSRYYLDVLNANLWAWAVGRVIYGPPSDNS